jgi:cytochrome c oxidase subunit II
MTSLSNLAANLAGLADPNDGSTYWFPPQASNHADLIDTVYYFIYWVSVVSFVLIVVMMVHFARKYAQKKRNDLPNEQSDHNTLLEIGWSLPVLIVGVILFYFGAIGYIDARTPPPGAYEIRVRAAKWSWEFTYPNGATSPDLHLPVNTPIRLVMGSDDVLHSFFVPAFRVKQDVVPGRYSDIYFEATQTGEFQIFCTEFCGTKHSEMLAMAIVHDEIGFRAELEKLANPLVDCGTPAECGLKVVTMKGCPQCHSSDGATGIGPSFKGLYDTDRPLTSGGSKKADENYIRSSILDPKADVVQGFNPVMPTFKGKIKDEEINAIIDYLKSLK